VFKFLFGCNRKALYLHDLTPDTLLVNGINGINGVVKTGKIYLILIILSLTVNLMVNHILCQILVRLL